MYCGRLLMKKYVLSFLIYCVICIVLTPTMASAYIDPSTTTFLVQAGIGVAVAIAAGFTIYFRKARKKINKAIGREEVTKDESDDLEDL